MDWNLARKTLALIFSLLLIISPIIAGVGPLNTISPVDNAQAASTDYIYVGTGGGSLSKVSDSNTEKWNKSYANPVKGVGVDGDFVYGGGYQFVDQYNPDGTAGFSNSYSGFEIQSIFSFNNGNSAFGTDGTTVKKIDSSGNLIWENSSVGTTTRGIGGNKSGYVFSGDVNGVLRAHSPNTGSEDWSTSFSGEIFGVDVGPNGYIYVTGTTSTDGFVAKVDNTGSVVWKNTNTGISQYRSVVASSNNLFVGDSNGDIHKLDFAGTNVWSKSFHGTDYVFDLTIDSNNYLYSGSGDNSMKKIDPSGGSPSTVWTRQYGGRVWGLDTMSSSDYTSAVSGTVSDSSGNQIENANVEIRDSSDSTVFTGSTDANGAWSTELGDGDYTLIADKDLYQSNTKAFSVSGSAKTVDISLSKYPEISGQVLDQDGEPVENATVSLWLVNDANTTTEAGETVEDAQEETLETLSRSVPRDLYVEDLDPLNAEEFTGENAGRQVLVHNPGAWFQEAEPIGPYQPTVGSAGTEDLKYPVRQLEPNTEYAFSIWDRKKDPTLEDGVDSKVEPGVSDSGTIQIEQVGPGNSTISVIEKNTTAQVRTGFGYTAKEHEYARVSLPEGYYRVEPAAAGGVPTILRVGLPEEIPRSIEPDLKDSEDRAAQIAQEVQDKIDSGEMKRVTVETDAQGRFSYNANPGYSTAAITAFDGMGLTEGLNEPTLGDLRQQIQQQDYNGSIYMSTSPKVVHPEATGVEIRVVENQNPTLQDLDTYLGQLEWFRNLTNQEAFLEAASLFNDPASTVGDETLEERGRELQELIEQNQELQNQVEKLINQDSTLTKEYTTIKKEIVEGGLTREEVEALLEAQRKALESNQSKLIVRPPGEVNLEPQEDGTTLLSTNFPVEAATLGQTTEISESGTEIIVHWDNGSSTRMSEEYWSIDNSATASQGGSGDIVVEEFPIPADVAVAKLDVIAANGEGVGTGGGSFENPTVEGNSPNLASINLNTMRPGPDETVTVSVEPTETSSFKSLDGATVYGPNGNEVSTTLDAGTIRFTTSGAGSYLVKLNVSDGQRPYIESFRVKAGEESVNYPASVRVHHGVLGRTALASDGVESARASVESGGSTARITAVVDPDDVPNKIEVHTRDLTGVQREVSVSVVKSTDESRVSKGVQVKIHSSRLDEDSHVRVNGNPITEDGSRWGKVDHMDDSTLLVTNLRDGSIDVSMNNNPGIWARADWWIDTQLAKYNPLAVVSTDMIPAGVVPSGFVGLGALAIFASKRRVGL